MIEILAPIIGMILGVAGLAWVMLSFAVWVQERSL